MANPQNLNFDSPYLSSQPVENSPMTNLALNLGSTNISVPVRRKLALASAENSPASNQGQSRKIGTGFVLLLQKSDGSLEGKLLTLKDGSPMVISPLKPSNCDRLLKQSLKFNSPGTPTSVVRRPGVPRRLGALSDENYNPMHSSPEKTFVSPSKFQAVRQLSSSRPRQPLEDQDPNSQDSGYCHSEDSKSVSSDFPFALPSGLAPRRSTTESSPRSRTSSESVDDGFLDFTSPLQDEEAQLPAGLGGLIKDPIINHGLSADSSHFLNLDFRRIVSDSNLGLSPIVEEKTKKRVSTTPLENTPVSKRYKALGEHVTPPRTKQHTLFQFGFKRLSEPRPLLSHSISLEEPSTPPPRPKFRHCLSESEAVIKSALHRSSEEELIGDFSKRFALPLVPGSHQDLKSISPNTLARLIHGDFEDTIASFQIIDCRYPYEYEGGHIRGARNMYTKDQVMKEFLENRPGPPQPSTPDGKRHIIVFHCEFSSERGPGLSRFLRSKDRETNPYPALHHPELYLLEGGYKAFFHMHPTLCEPQAYRKMVDADKEQLQHFRAKSKTWSGDKSNRTLKRSASFKRLGL